jgi:hypothetical protein
MMRTLTAVGAMLGVVLTAPLASAQAGAGAGAGGAFGQQGQFIVSADRLFTLFGWTRQSIDDFIPPNGVITKSVTTDTQTSLGFFWGSTFPAIETFYTVPRLGFDYTIVDHITIGGEVIAFFTVGGSTGTEVDRNNGMSVTNSSDRPSFTVFGIAPRGGYILGLSDLFSLWLRGGFSYYTASQKSTIDMMGTKQTNSFQQFAIDLDPQLVITPIRHFGFTVGITGDIPIGGGHSQETVPMNGATTNLSAPSSFAFIGVTAGMLGWF